MPSQRQHQEQVGDQRECEGPQHAGGLGWGELEPIDADGHRAAYFASCTDRPTRYTPARCSVSITFTTVSYFTLRSALITTAESPAAEACALRAVLAT